MNPAVRIKILLAGALLLTLFGGWLQIESLAAENLRLSQTAAQAGAEKAALRDWLEGRLPGDGQKAGIIKPAQCERSDLR